MSIRIAEEIINGRRLNREDDLAFFMAVSYTHLTLPTNREV